MRTLYLDCFAGIAGDMLTGALYELAPNRERFPDELTKLVNAGGLSENDFHIELKKDARGGVTGTRFCVTTHEHHPHRGLGDIEKIVMNSPLSDRIRRESLRAFSLLAEAEAAVHGTTPDKIHFHEVGAIDSILDILGVFILIDMLGWPRILCSPVNVGSGTVRCAHGILPVPAPATERLLRGLPICSCGEPMERTTPTGALLVRSLADGFCGLPAGTLISSGYGLGSRESDIPNVLRVLLLDSVADFAGAEGSENSDRVALLESNIDDMNPQDYETVMESLFEAGALDAWLESLFMKKGRPGVKLSCICPLEKADILSSLILRETTTQGVRRAAVDRLKLCYKIENVTMSLGTLRVKTAFMDGRPLRRAPEYEDLKRLAGESGLPLPVLRNRIAAEISDL